MKKYDTESFLLDIEKILKARLNNKIDVINIEKGDFNIAHINDKAYVCQTLDNNVASYNEFIFYMIDDIGSVGIGPATAEFVAVDIVVIMNTVADNNRTKKLLRYQRALKELFNEGFNDLKFSKKVTIESLVPISFTLQNSSRPSDCIGIRVTMNLT